MKFAFLNHCLIFAASVLTTVMSALGSQLPLNDSPVLTLKGRASIITGGQGKFGEALSINGTNGRAPEDTGTPVSGGDTQTISAWFSQTNGVGSLRAPVALGIIQGLLHPAACIHSTPLICTNRLLTVAKRTRPPHHN